MTPTTRAGASGRTSAPDTRSFSRRLSRAGWVVSVWETFGPFTLELVPFITKDEAVRYADMLGPDERYSIKPGTITLEVLAAEPVVPALDPVKLAAAIASDLATGSLSDALAWECSSCRPDVGWPEHEYVDREGAITLNVSCGHCGNEYMYNQFGEEL